MPANAKRKAARRLKFGRGAPATETEHIPAAAPSSAPSSDNGDDANDEENGGVSLQPEEDAAEAADSDAPPAKKKKPAPAPRYILFVGNLPFEATTAGVQRHFAAVGPTAVRLATEKQTGKARGFAFLEFDSHKSMDACLTRYHRSEYVEDAQKGVQSGKEADADGDGTDARTQPEQDENQDENYDNTTSTERRSKRREGKQGARRINVQLTAGGGGKSATRQKRLQEKNEKLDRERHKRLKKAKSKKEERHQAAEKKKKEAGTSNGTAGSHIFEAEEGMHPSRKARFAAT